MVGDKAEVAVAVNGEHNISVEIGAIDRHVVCDESVKSVLARMLKGVARCVATDDGVLAVDEVKKLSC